MTPSQWGTSTDWLAMADVLTGPVAGDPLLTAHYARKLRLLPPALARIQWASYDARIRRGVVAIEALADRLPFDEDQLLGWSGDVQRACLERPAGVKDTLALLGYMTLSSIDPREELSTIRAADGYIPQQYEAFCAEVLRDLVGDPFPPRGETLDREWQATPDGQAAARLAQDIYYGYRFDRVGELADALDRAGCPDATVVAHLRQPTWHGRGCWAVDAVLRPGPDPVAGLLTRPRLVGDLLAAYLIGPKIDPLDLYRG